MLDCFSFFPVPLTAAEKVKREVGMKLDLGKWLVFGGAGRESAARTFRTAALLGAKVYASQPKLLHDEVHVGAQEPANVIDGGAAATRSSRGLLTRLLEVRP